MPISNVDDKLLNKSEGSPKNDDAKPLSSPSDSPSEALPEAAKADDSSDIGEANSEEADKAAGETKQDSKKEEGIDEYGNEVKQQKLYTEDEVNAIMRDRAKRGRFREETQSVQTSQQPHDSSDDWQQELEGFVKQTISKLSAEEQQKQQKQQDEALQVEFEDKFARGMQRYGDFEDVVKGKPIDDHMVLATRGMSDPAGFIYAAAKTYPKELTRINQIRDPYSKALEMGKLEERMRKVRAGSQSPRPLQRQSGDVENVGNPKRSVDDLIREDAKRKLAQRRY